MEYQVIESSFMPGQPLQPWEKHPAGVRYIDDQGRMYKKRPKHIAIVTTVVQVKPKKVAQPRSTTTPQQKNQRIVFALSKHEYPERINYTTTVFPYRKSIHGPNCAEHREYLARKGKAMSRDMLKERGFTDIG